MTNDPYRNTGGGSADDLQFDRVEPAAPPPPAGLGEPIPAAATMPEPGAPAMTVCGACNEPITDAYYEANGKVVCPRCREAVMASQAGGSRTGRFLRATIYGIFAGIVGAAIWWGIRVASGGYEIGLIAILVGFMVGGAVKAGAKGRGGFGYQLLAVVLTYLAIAANYAPDIVQALRSQPGAADNVVAVIIITAIYALAAPFFGGFQNIIGLLIIGFALFQAWVINKSGRIAFNGPYRLAPAAAGVAPAAAYPYGAPPPPPPVGQA